MNTRYLAVTVITQVLKGSSLSDTLDPAVNQLKDPRDKGFVQALCYGVCRYYSRLEFVLDSLLSKSLNKKEVEVKALLLIGLYQLMEMRVPEHAAVAETVNVVKKLDNKSWARGLVNAVLRNYLRQKDSLQQKIEKNESAHYAHPLWWIKALKAAYPDEYQSILEANNQHPPFVIRSNQAKMSRDDYLAKLNDAGISANAIAETASGILVEEALSVEQLPGFHQGEVSVQDAAAQLAAEFLAVQPGERVLDACAAPGGKLTHMLEMERTISVLAVEKDVKRCELVRDNLKRLGQQAECLAEDVLSLDKWWDKNSFDRILLDAPCSASGIIRRHPDIKLLRQERDIKQLALLQADMLKTLWSALRPGGVLLYATCSVFPQENIQVISEFLKNHPDAEMQPLTIKGSQSCKIGLQILPGMYGMDGFYYAKLAKKS